MSEKVSFQSPEHQLPPSERAAEKQRAQHEKPGSSEPSERDAANRLHELRKTIDELPAAGGAKEALKASQAVFSPVQNGHVSKQLKKIALRRELKLIRQHLSPASRSVSRLVHQPVIRLVSEATDKTVGRPSGLLGGGLVAFLGTTTYFYLSKHIGFTYNYTVFLALFVGGFAVGICLEFLVWLAVGRYKKNS